MDILLACGNFICANTRRMKAAATQSFKDDSEPPVKVAREGNNNLEDSHGKTGTQRFTIPQKRGLEEQNLGTESR